MSDLQLGSAMGSRISPQDLAALIERVEAMNRAGDGTMTTPGMLDPRARGVATKEPRNVAYQPFTAPFELDDIMPMWSSLQFGAPVGGQLPAALMSLRHTMLPWDKLNAASKETIGGKLSPQDLEEMTKGIVREKELDSLLQMPREAQSYPFAPGVGFEGTRLAEREALRRFLDSYAKRPFNDGSLWGNPHVRDAQGRIMSAWDLLDRRGPPSQKK